MEARVLRLLIVDASPDDAEAAFAALRRGNFLLKPERVQDLAGLQQALAKSAWDAVICERALPRLKIETVLETLHRAGCDAPLVVLTRDFTDEEMLALVRAGARDVIRKSRLGRLLPALERELAVAAERAAHRATLKALEEMRQKHRAVVEGAREAICYSHEGMHIDANRAYLELFEYESTAELEGVPLTDLIDKSDQGRFKQYIRKPDGAPQEFVAVRRSGARFHAEIAAAPITLNGEACLQLFVADVSKRKAAETRLQFLNQRDPLTGLYNRAHFLRALEEALAGVKAGGAARALVYVALPASHANGPPADPAAAERLLLLAARALNEVFGSGATLARIGDREFAALLDAAQTDRLSALCDAAERALKQHIAEANVNASGGCRVAGVTLDAGAQGAEAVLNALYAAEAAPAAPAEVPTAVEWPARIRAALERGAFRLVYQPIVHLHGDGGELFEVLVRMVADDGTLIPAGEFMPPAEAAGLAAAIDRWVVRHAIRALAELRRQKRKVTFFINLSAAGLEDVELAVTTQQALHETQLKGKYVVFELDEAAFTSRPDAALAFMRAAGRLGCSFCIDNFGRALDAAHRLRESPVAYLKLDGALARGVVRDPVAQASLKAVVEVAKSMEKKTIAKSVESAEALSVLWTFGIDYVQGHYFQEADSELRYDFAGEATLSSESSPQWVASTGKSR